MHGPSFLMICFSCVCIYQGAAETQPKKQQKPANAMLLETTELQKRLADGKSRVVDCRSKGQYLRGHIPTAVWVDVAAWRTLAKSKGGFRNAGAWSKLVGELGIGKATPVVVYGDSLSNTARIWWLLKYLGHKDVAILNGGWNLWVKQGRPQGKKRRTYAKAQYRPAFQSDRLEEMDTLKKNLKSTKIKIVDTRSKGEYTGKIIRGKRGGHILGATHLEWKELVAKDGRFKSKVQLKALFRRHGILPGQTAVCY